MCCGRLPARLDLQGRLDRGEDEERQVPEEDPPQGSGASGAEDSPEQPRVPPGASEETGAEPSKPSSSGSMRFQDPATARPRPPTVGETRAREKAERERKAAERAQFEANVKRYHRNQRLKGGAAVVGVVGVVAALGYWALSPRTTTAQCVQEDANGGPIVVPDNYCTGNTSGGGGGSGFFFYSGGHQYRYYYGSTGTVGSRPVGGTTIAPKGTTVKTSSGSTIQRGGLGSKFSGSGGG
jgi:hypothetical protein